MRRALLTMGLLFALGCAEDFLPASYVDELRPVAARVEVEGEPSRPNPYPGDVISVTQHVIDAGPKPAIEWRFVACVPIVSVFTPPPCARLIEPCENCISDDRVLNVDPVVRFQVPSEEELGDADQVVLQGAICEGELASEDRLVELLLGGVEDTNPCANPKTDENVTGDEGRLVSVRIPIEQQEDSPNLHPEIESVAIGGGNRWLDLLPSQSRTGCLERIEKPEQCVSSLDGKLAVLLSVTPESLQPFRVERDGETRELQEDIQISWLADAGGFERSFSFIDETSSTVESNPFESVSWTQPSLEGLGKDESFYVRFNFVIRDGRGGTAWEEHGLCIVHPVQTILPPCKDDPLTRN